MKSQQEKARRRRRRREIQLLSSESAWLQKALFALQKAEAAREKLADSRDEDVPPFELPLDDETLSVEEFQEAMENRIHDLLEDVRGRRRTLR